MKKALLFCLAVWVVLFALPWTRPQALLDWWGATVEQFSGDVAAWAPLDAPYRPEKNAFSFAPGMTTDSQDEVPDSVVANELSVTPQFGPVARSSKDRDVLVWCALSATDSKVAAKNMAILERRFPKDAALLAWECSAQISNLSMTTRVLGPLTSGSVGWSVQNPEKAPYPVKVAYGERPQWNEMVEKAREGEKLEPRNGFWWWLEAMALLGARRDEEVWSVLKAGSAKTQFDDHCSDKLLALRSAHLKVLGMVPSVFYLNTNTDSYLFYSRWREVARQVCENVMGARLVERHKVAVEGGRDLMLMGRLLRFSNNDISVLMGIAIENIALKNALLPASSTLKRLASGASATALAGHPRSLLRYANELKRKDIALQVTNEWNAINQANRKQQVKLKAALAKGNSQIEGVSDTTMALAVGSQNTGALLVQTLPIPLIAIGVLSLLLLVRRRKDDGAFALPAWTRGLVWSAFALATLLGAQILLSHMVWQFLASSMGWTAFWGYNFALPRLVAALPLWAFAFAACVMGVGAIWATVIAARRARGHASLWMRLQNMLSSPDERTGTLNLGPLLQLIGLVGAWGLLLSGLGAWFYFPQNGSLENQAGSTLHDDYAGLALAVFCVVAILPAFLFRIKAVKIGGYFWGWVRVTRRFLVAHLVLTTILYLLLAVNGAFWRARVDGEWLRANAPSALSNGN